MSDFSHYIGSPVCLNSGGPVMTVIDVEAYAFAEDGSRHYLATCSWFDDSDELHEANFDTRCLVNLDDEDADEHEHEHVEPEHDH